VINPDEVGLIIFDLGGTLISDVKADYEAVRRAFEKLGWRMPVGNEREYLPYMTMPSDDFYRTITPPEHRDEWQAGREVIRQEYFRTFPEFSRLYPGVIGTLKTLRGQCLHLALYSRAASKIVVDTSAKLGIDKYFDYIKTDKDDGTDKIDLARQIIIRYDVPAAVVGDSIHDIDVARKTGSLAIGVKYGYGGKEVAEADILLSRFSDLLQIFARGKKPW
jgi:phosphoglycolate phosphatase